MNQKFYIKYLKYKSKYQSMINTIYMGGGCKILEIPEYFFQLKTKTGIVKYTVKLIEQNKIDIYVNSTKLESYDFDFNVNLLVGIQIAIVILNKVYGLKTLSSNGKRYELSTTNQENKYNIYDTESFFEIYGNIFSCDIDTIKKNMNIEKTNEILKNVNNDYNKDKQYFENISHPEKNTTNPSASTSTPPKQPESSTSTSSKQPEPSTSTPPEQPESSPPKQPESSTPPKQPESFTPPKQPEPSVATSSSTGSPQQPQPKTGAKSDEDFSGENRTVVKPKEITDVSFYVF